MGEHEDTSVKYTIKLAGLATACLMALAVGLAGSAVGAEITWKPAQLFQRYSHDEDIRDVLRNVLRQNGNDVVFTAGVSGTITHRFNRVPLQGVFNMLIGQNDLLYSFDADRNTVYVRPPGDAPPKRKPKRRRQPRRT